MTIRVIACLCCFSLTTACAIFSPAGPADLRLHSVQAIRSADTKIAWGQPQMLLRVNFLSIVNLQQLADDYGFLVANRASMGCGAKYEVLRSRRLSLSGVFFGSDLEVTPDGTDLSASPSPNQPVMYYTLFPIKGRVLNEEENDLGSPYDFERQPDDICLQVVGGDMVGRSFASNILKIPREVIVVALRKK